MDRLALFAKYGIIYIRKQGVLRWKYFYFYITQYGHSVAD